MSRRRRRIERGMLAPANPPSSQLQHVPESHCLNHEMVMNHEMAELGPATPGEKAWMLTLAALMAAVMMAWLGFLSWAAWRLLWPLLP